MGISQNTTILMKQKANSLIKSNDFIKTMKKKANPNFYHAARVMEEAVLVHIQTNKNKTKVLHTGPWRCRLVSAQKRSSKYIEKMIRIVLSFSL